MIPSQPLIRLARVTLETTAPLSIASGRNDGIFDTHLVRDANGLPLLPGTALAGVLRHQLVDRLGEAAADRLFGHLGNRTDNTGHASRVSVTHGHLHDQDNHPVDGLCSTLSPWLAPLANALPPKRDHVRLNRRGSVDGSGKFDRAFLPAGHRFSFDLILQSETDDAADWQALTGALACAGFRLGGATRAGYGAVIVRSIRALTADLSRADGLAAFAAWPARLDAPLPPAAEPIPLPADADDALALQLVLTPEAGFRIGQPGAPSLSGDSKPADAVPYTERRIVWHNDKASEGERQIVIPASSVKGALRHRTAFHHARLSGRFIPREARLDERANPDDGLAGLFGEAGDTPDSGAGRAGCLWFDDAVLGPDSWSSATQMHVAIDRFTGGARAGRLFKEELVHTRQPDAIALRIALDRARLGAVESSQRRALRLALDDLAEGRLALGAASSRGHGFFTGRIEGALAELENTHD